MERTISLDEVRRSSTKHTRDDDNEPDSVDGDFVLAHSSEETSIGKTVVTREGVERTSVRLGSGSDDLESDETDESPEDVEPGRSDVLSIMKRVSLGIQRKLAQLADRRTCQMI